MAEIYGVELPIEGAGGREGDCILAPKHSGLLKPVAALSLK